MRNACHACLALLLAFSLWTGLTGIDFGYHWDEHRVTDSVIAAARTGRPLPGWYNYPSVIFDVVITSYSIHYTKLYDISILVEEGKLSYEDPVRKYIPSFDNYRSGFILIRHLLNHTSGFRINSLFLQPLMEPSAEHPEAPSLQLEVVV